MEKPVIAKESPMAVDLKEGQDYYWCSCGRSASQPFCDGAHKGTSFSPVKFTAEKDGTRYLCCCKMTKKAPFCDGAHQEL